MSVPKRGQADKSKPAQKGKQSPVDKIRKFFPETWLFSAVVIGPDGQAVVNETAPDTITTWLTSAFAVHPQQGLSVMKKPTQLTTFRKMFVSLDLPYSAVRGEDLCLKAFAYNYHDKPLYMRMSMARSEGLSNIRLVRTSWTSKKRVEYRVPMRVSHRIGKVEPNGMAKTTFCFTPIALGEQIIRVNLTAGGMAGDGVERKLLVQPEGMPRAQSIPVILDINKGGMFEREVNISFPSNAVPGSQQITVAVASDLLGSVFENIDDLLRMPYGCGEQNMLYFAPNVFLIDYLKRTNTYSPKVAAKAEHYMLVGYQKELKYKHNDFSYSAFGQRKPTDSGSMWLTAFVTKCFAQSMALGEDVISIDAGIVNGAVNWMISRQNRNGSFSEPGKVFNKNMQGGSAKGEALTAYVLIALVEANKTLTDMNAIQRKKLTHAIDLARIHLEQRLIYLNDSYDLAIVTYALHLTKSSLANTAFSRLQSKSILDSLMVHWERTKPKTTRYSWQRQTDAINIEMTAYALLTYLERNDVGQALPIVRWLTSQRGPQGGFISTQDTVIGLQALAKIATEIYQPVFSPITVSMDWFSKEQINTHSLTLDDQNKLLLHKFRVPIKDGVIPESLHIRANSLSPGNFSGLAVAEVTLDYNIRDATNSSTYTLDLKFTLLDEDKYILEVKASRVDGKMGSMTVIEVGLPTGYNVDDTSDILFVDGAKMIEPEDRKFVLYYDEMGRDPLVARLPVTMSSGIIVNSHPADVKIYDYYESGGDLQMTVTYMIPKVSSVCERNPEYESCPYSGV